MALKYQNSFYTYNTLVDFDLVSSKSFIKSLNTNLVKYYTIAINTIILFYGMFLGFSTMYSWNSLVLKSTAFLLITRTVFFLVFVFDFSFVIMNSKIFKNYNIFKTIIDFLFLLVDVAIIILLIIFLIFGRNLTEIIPGSHWDKMNESLRILFCMSVFRLYKLCFLFKPLLNLSQGIFLTMRSLVWTGVFVFLVIYSCSIMTTWVFNDKDDNEMFEFWGSLVKSMYTLFTVLTLEGWNEVSNRTAIFYPSAKIFFVLYVCFTTLTVMNVVTGIILDTFITASENLYAEKFYKGTYKNQFNVSRLVNMALKKMKYTPPEEKQYSRKASDLSIESISDSVPQGNLSSYKKYFRHFFSRRRREKEYKQKIKNFDDLQGRTSFQKKEFSSFETRSSEDPETTVCRISSDNERYSLKKSSSFNENIGKKRENKRIINIRSSPNLNQYNIYSLEDQPTEDNRQNEAERRRSDFINNFKRYSNFGSEDGHDNDTNMNESSHNLLDGNHMVNMETTRESPMNNSNNVVLFNGMNKNYNYQEIIDLDENDPTTIINDEVMEEALKAANISKYHAYDVLNMYYVNGFRKIRVQEFAISCSRISGNASNRDLLSFELIFRRRLDNLEKSISGLGEKLDKIVDSFYKK